MQHFVIAESIKTVFCFLKPWCNAVLLNNARGAAVKPVHVWLDESMFQRDRRKDL